MLRALQRDRFTDIPCVNGMYFQTHLTLKLPLIKAETLKKINVSINRDTYENYCRNKYKKPATDVYALFDTVNESFKAFFPFIPLLKARLKKGDYILNLWCRTGWSAAVLSGLFPDQKIITQWNGNSDVLGHNGYSYWFANKEYPLNMEVIFSNLQEGLPFRNNIFSLVLGYDLLHRIIRSRLLEEIDRVTAAESMVIFPHVHLSNSQPDPYFKRGGDQIHGRQYEKLFDQFSAAEKKARIFSEPDLYRFSRGDQTSITSNKDTGDYNGLLVIAPVALDLSTELKPFNFHDYFPLVFGNLLINPLLETDPGLKIRLRTDFIKDALPHLLDNHPVYFNVLKHAIGYQLTNTEQLIMYWAGKCRSVDFIQHRLKLGGTEFTGLIKNLEKLDILQLLPVSAHHLRLQRLLSHVQWIEPIHQFNLLHLWNRSVRVNESRIYINNRKDTSTYTYAESDQIIHYICSTLAAHGLKKADSVMLHADLRVESIALFWACMKLGLVFIPLSPDLPDQLIIQLVARYQPALIFLNEDIQGLDFPAGKICLFDEVGNTPSTSSPSFSVWLTDAPLHYDLPEQGEADLAVILHTSGSSGQNKGVLLTHGQLFQSAINFTETYQCSPEDNYLGLGQLNTMSGLRNACIVTAYTGGACIIPTPEERHNPAALLDCMLESGITLLVTNPALLNQLLLHKNAAGRLRNVRITLSTGSNLSSNLKMKFKEITGKELYNYYGLTETTGICIAQRPGEEYTDGNNIGKPVDCLAKIVNELDENVPSGTIGELLVYCYTLTSGYTTSGDKLPLNNDGWYKTGDLALLQADGSFLLQGRIRDQIKNAHSELVFCHVIEEIVRELDFTTDVAVIPWFHNEAEHTAVFLTLKQGSEKDIIEQVKARIQLKLGATRVPAYIKITSQIPRSPDGKIKSQELTVLL